MMAGVYKIKYYIDGVGYARLHSSIENFTFEPVVTDTSTIESSLAGGSLLTFTGKGFPTLSNKDFANVKVCGQHCLVSESSYNSLKCKTPVINTQEVQDSLNLLSPEIQRDAVVTGDKTITDMNRIIDGDFNTYYYGNSNSDCWVNLDFGENVIISATQIRMFPRASADEKLLVGGQFVGISEDGTETILAEVPETVVENWNTYKPKVDTNEKWNFRHLKFVGGVKHCSMAEIEVTGYKFSNIQNLNISSHDCDASLNILGADAPSGAVLSNKVTYKETMTPKVNGISPNLGTTAGGTLITITGQMFQTDSTVTIDGIDCPVASVNTNTITCTTGSRPTFTDSTFEIYSPTIGLAATHGHLFLYIDRWSDPNTWGGEAPPREGDSVHVPKGQVLLVDVSPPPLYTIIVEGVIMWEDKSKTETNPEPMTFEAWFIMVREGQFKIGSPEEPYEGKLTITMHGNKESKQLPGFGNKSIMVQNGQIDIHGKPLDKTWTFLETGAIPGDTQITLTEDSQWNIGDEIIIAPTGQDRDEVEERVITAINGKVLTLDKALEFYHFSGEIDPNNNHNTNGEVEPNNTIDPPNRDSPFILRGEVGLLTRNVKIQGDETTETTNHGVHIMVRGQEGVVRGRFSYFEVFRAGQKFQLGRYPIHFHMIGHVVDNYVKGCSVHHTFNRGTTLHGVHYLTLEKNVYYRTMGHTIFLEDGIETNNVIQDNLVVHVSKSTSMLMSDLKPSGLWQARPTNFIRRNHFVGCAGNGAWFELVHHPTGPSATDSICSVGDHLTQYEENVHHSNVIGLRVYPHYFPKTDPCVEHFNNQLRDPYSHNPGMPARYLRNTMYMNGLGSFGKIIGAVQYIEQRMISNATNQKIVRPHIAKDSLARVEDSISIGDSELTFFHQTETGSPKFSSHTALLLGSKSGFLVKNTRFYNFKSKESSMVNLCGPCRNEKKRDKGGVQTNWENNQFKNIHSQRFRYSDALYDKDIQRDIDGSLISIMVETDEDRQFFSDGGWITPWFPHLEIPECKKIEKINGKVNYDSAVCKNTINLRRLKHTIINDTLLLNGQDMKLFNLGKWDDQSNKNGFTTDMKDPETSSGRLLSNRVLQTETSSVDDQFGFNKYRNCKLSMDWRGWVSVVPTGYQYNFHFGTGVEWIEMKTENDYYWGLDGPENPVFFRHNYTEPRETYEATFEGVKEDDEFGVFTDDELKNNEITENNSFGDFAINNDDQFITWKVDGKRIGSYTNKVIYCSGLSCNADPEANNIIEDTIRNWDDVSSWTSGVLPTADDNETVIEDTWNMHLNIIPPNLKHLKIKGRLTFSPDIDDLALNAYLIEIIQGGQLIIGSRENPHTRNASINLLGNKASEYLVISSDIAPVNKAILNKGILHLYGKSPAVAWTHLADKIEAGDSFFYVEGTGHEWNINDELVIASSSSKAEELEKVVIKQIIPGTGKTEIKINGVFAYAHYGSSGKNTTSKGSIDMRAEVGNLTRNVKITSDLEDEWGCTVLTPSFNLLERNSESLQGNLVLDGIEIQNCGQRDTRKAAIDLNWVKKVKGSHSITNSTFNNGQGWAVNMEKAEGLFFKNNVIYNARRYGIYLGENVAAVSIEDNLIIGIKERSNYDNIEYFDTYIGIFYDSSERLWTEKSKLEDQVIIKGNSVSSSPWFGYAFPGNNCPTDDDPLPKENRNFYDNVAHSNRVGWIPTKLDDQDCAIFSYFHSYKNWEQGFVQRADIKEIEIEHMILADNRNGIVINGGNGKEYPSVKFRDSAVIGKILDDCPECYKGDDCETTGMITSLFNKSVYDFYWEDTRLPMHNSTNVKFSFGGTQEVESVDFVNFNESSECPNTKQTAIRMNNFYQDNGVFITFKDISLQNVDDKNKLFFPNHKKHLDSPAYCGKIDCTANYNNLFHDVNGNIMGTNKDMQYFGNNIPAGRDGDCTFFEDWNGHACNPTYGQLLLTRQPDERGLNIFPLHLKIEKYEDDISDDLKFANETNGPLEVTSLIKLGVETFVSTSQTMPSGLTYQLNSKNDSDYVIIKIQSENPATMNIMKRTIPNQRNNRRAKPVVLKPGQELNMHNYKGSCGTNYYEAANRILYFVVTGNNCEVTVEFANALQLSTRLNIDPDTFFDSDGITTFLDRMAALLEISVDRIKVVDVRQGSTIVVTEIMSENSASDERSDKDSVIEEFESYKAKFENAVANDEIDLGAPVLDIESEMAIDNVEPVVVDTIDDNADDNTTTTDSNGDTPTDEDTSGSNTTKILLGVLIPLAIIIIGVIIFFVVKKLKAPKASNSEKNLNNETKDLTSNRNNAIPNYVVNNNQPQKFGTMGKIKFSKQLSLNQNNKIESYIKRKN